jgi:medium-chain acyl-[acyl-carrier-protein] hydrolase
MTPAASAWILRPRPRAGARLRLFCFPFAGGTAAAYRSWTEALPSQVDVCPIQLPGRGSRFREAPFRRASDLVGAAADALRPHLDLPFAFFGHSMGALVAFELAREFRRRSWPGPVLLAVSGHHAPQRPDPDPPFGHLPDAEFLEEIRVRYDGIPAEVLAEEELLKLVLPVMRADVLVLESHPYAEEPPLDCALSCFGGEQDRHTRRDDLEAWREQTRGPFTLRTFPGGHFFIESAREAVLRALSEDLVPGNAAAEEARA